MKILLLAGGESGEREVSLATGKAVFESLRRLNHTVFAIDTLNGKSLLGLDSSYAPIANTSPDKANLPASRTDVRAFSSAITSPGFKDVDVVFIALHGGTGENGAIQSLLQMTGKRFTGSGMTASAVAMNKSLSKGLFVSAGIRTPEWYLCDMDKEDAIANATKVVAARFECPLIVKPDDGGSTLGLTKVETMNDLNDAIELAAKYSHRVLIETFVEGRELTVAVLDGKALPVVEIIPASGLYDYEAKYTKGKSNYVAPADIDEAVATELQQISEKVYEIIGASGAARVDFILDRSGQAYCLELNTLPGMTELSLVPMAAQAAGISFDELVQRIIDSASDK